MMEFIALSQTSKLKSKVIKGRQGFFYYIFNRLTLRLRHYGITALFIYIFIDFGYYVEKGLTKSNRGTKIPPKAVCTSKTYLTLSSLLRKSR
ncbi:hypothetical protein GQX74_008861 [Glossina fuscipes]|nr:hypothetical protein GQX74_008861 [Glossina fuscipes]